MRALHRCCALTLALSALAGAARAQPDPAAAAAQALFDAARERMERGLYDEACPKLEEALRLAPGAVGAKLRLGECYEGQGRLASAWAMYVAAESAARAAGQAEREQRAREGAARVDPRVSRITVAVPPVLRALPGLVVWRDGVAVGAGQWGEPIPVDGGRHEVSAAAPGKARWTRALDVPVERGVVRVEIGPLVDLPPPFVPAPQLPLSSLRAEAPQRAPVWAWLLGAGGLALGAAGAGFGIDCVVVGARQADLCGPGLDHCERASPRYDPASDNARRARDYGLFLGFSGAGLGALIAATAGLVTARRAPSTTALPWVLPGGGGVLLGGRF